MLEVSEEEFEARAAGNWKTASELFKRNQAQFHTRSNQARNASLYVDWLGDAFIAPSERIDAEMLADIKERNATFLAYAFNNLKALKRLSTAPDDMRELMLDFVEKAQKLRADAPSNFMEEYDALLYRFLEDGKAKLASLH